MSRLAAFVPSAFLPSLALAAAQAHDEHHGVPWAKLLFSTINLLIFLYILRRFAWPLVRDWLAARREQVVADLERAARAKREAESLAAEWRARLANLDAELAEIRRRSEAEIDAEREEILRAARRLADSILRDAKKVAEQELASAQLALRAEVAKQALDIASRVARQRFSADDQRRFVDEFTGRVNP